jgi:protein-histidine pros-kinase
MKLPGPLTADQERQLRTVRTSAQHLLSLINDLLDVAKIESGKLDLTLAPVALDSVVQEVATTLRPLADGKGLRLEVDVPKPNIVVRADQRAVTQIVLNLVNNAIKFTQAGSVGIAVDQQRDDGQVRTEIRVVDTGPGILPEDQVKLFQAVSQVGSSLQHHQQGTGLGLHLSQLLARLMSARITVQSEYGQGSTFALSWSGEEADQVAHADDPTQRSPG